jgi:hypothetical protein
MRQIALDVHQGFCEIAIREDGQTRSAGRVATSRASLELFADSLCPPDEVMMEATGPAMEIARIISPRVVRVVVANAQDVRPISHARVKSDRFDARTLAELLAAGMLDQVSVPDPETQALRRRVARRAALVRQRTRAKNEIHATLARSLLGHPPVSDLFGSDGRAWLLEQQQGEEEAETLSGCLRQVDFLDAEIELIDQKLIVGGPCDGKECHSARQLGADPCGPEPPYSGRNSQNIGTCLSRGTRLYLIELCARGVIRSPPMTESPDSRGFRDSPQPSVRDRSDPFGYVR